VIDCSCTLASNDLVVACSFAISYSSAPCTVNDVSCMLAWVSALTHAGAGSKLDVSFLTSLSI